MKNDVLLLDEFVGSFGKLCEMAEYADIYPIVSELAVGEPDQMSKQSAASLTSCIRSCPALFLLFSKACYFPTDGRKSISECSHY